MTPERRTFLAWFLIGIGVPPALYGFGVVVDTFGLSQVGRAFELFALGICPFWLFLWLPAMSHSDNEVLFFTCVVAVLLANGGLYLVMAQLQNRLVGLKPNWRVATLSIAYPILMAFGYCLLLGLEAL